MNYCLDARTATDHFPGIARYVVSLTHALIPLLANDERLILILDPKAVSFQKLPEELRTAGKIVHAKSSPFDLNQQWEIPRLLKQVSASIYHSPYYLMPYRPRVPTIVTIYDLIPVIFPQSVSVRARLLFRIATRFALGAADRLITISETTERDLSLHFPDRAALVSAIPLAPQSEFIRKSAVEVAGVRERYGLPQAYALYFGINKPHKNLGRLIEAWALALKHWGPAGPAPVLAIAGAWDDRYPDARRLSANLDLQDQVRFLGPIPEAHLPALYSGARFFIFPSLYEGFGLPVLEAMACGTAVACSNTSSLPEVAGEAALFFDPRSPDEIAHAIRQLWEDAPLRETLASAGVKRASEFSWRQCAAQTLALYRQLAGTGPFR